MAPEDDLEVGAHYDGYTWTGFRFGSGPLLARIYSKTHEAQKNTEAWFTLLEYGNPEGHVIRVEFQIRAETLASMVSPNGVLDLRDFGAFVEAVPAVWAYLTGQWLVLRAEKGPVRIRKRGPHPLWVVVQRAFPENPPVLRPKLPPKASAMDLFSQAVGVLLRAFAEMRKSPRQVYRLLTAMARFAGFPRGSIRLLREKDFWDKYELVFARTWGTLVHA